MKPLELPDVMLCAVSSVAVKQTLRALQQSSKMITFGDVVLFTDTDPDLPAETSIRWHPISPLRSKEEYSRFMIKDLGRYTSLPFVLVVQWDGYVLDHRNWDPKFLLYDYIGAPWPQFNDGCAVGNGGFSLRSQRLLNALKKEEFAAAHPEDVAICRSFRKSLEGNYGIRFADDILSSKFSVERSGKIEASFGFHGFFNFPEIMSMNEVEIALNDLPQSVLYGRDGADFIRCVAVRGNRRLAWKLLARRFRKLGFRWDQLQLSYALLCSSFR